MNHNRIFLIDLSIQSKCNIISYDYPGFGCSTQKTEEKQFNLICDNLMDFCLNYLKYKIENVLLIGKGIGAMNSLHISYDTKYNNCKGMILIWNLQINRREQYFLQFLQYLY